MRILSVPLTLALSLTSVAAAELPTMRAPPPKAAVKCQIGDMKGVMLPGTSVCLKMGGYVTGSVQVGTVRQH
jgi:hypothetical protein